MCNNSCNIIDSILIKKSSSISLIKILNLISTFSKKLLTNSELVKYETALHTFSENLIKFIFINKSLTLKSGSAILNIKFFLSFFLNEII